MKSKQSCARYIYIETTHYLVIRTIFVIFSLIPVLDYYVLTYELSILPFHGSCTAELEFELPS